MAVIVVRTKECMALEDGKRRKEEKRFCMGDMEILKRATPMLSSAQHNQISPRKVRSSDLPGRTRDFQEIFTSTKALFGIRQEVSRQIDAHFSGLAFQK
jgi:hypothetical protein